MINQHQNQVWTQLDRIQVGLSQLQMLITMKNLHSKSRLTSADSDNYRNHNCNKLCKLDANNAFSRLSLGFQRRLEMKIIDARLVDVSLWPLSPIIIREKLNFQNCNSESLSNAPLITHTDKAIQRFLVFFEVWNLRFRAEGLNNSIESVW